MQNPIVIIGSGLAGYMLAKEIRKLDVSIPLVIITAADGNFYSKPQLSTALSAGKTAVDLIVTETAVMAQQLNATILPHSWVSAICPAAQEIQIEQKKVKYSQLVLACGADVIKPTLTGDAAAEVISINHLHDYAKFRLVIENKKRVVILGAGLIGCEFANDLINTGHVVDIIALSAYPLNNLVPPQVGKVITTALQKRGINWHFNNTVIAVNKYKNAYKVVLSNGQVLVADCILSAIGLRPHTELAKTAGIKTNLGIVVNEYLRTNIDTIYALGDCAEVNGMVLQYVAPLLNCARALAKTLTGTPVAVHYPIMPIGVKMSACPLVVCSVPAGVGGKWTISGEGENCYALFYDAANQLRGFVLTGDAVKEKIEFIKKLI